MFDIIGKKWWFLLFSGLIIIPGIVSLAVFGLKPAIDFTGGTLLEFQVDKLGNTASESAQIKTKSSSVSAQLRELNSEEIKKIGLENGIEISSIQVSGERSFVLRMKTVDKEQNKKFEDNLGKNFGKVTQLRFETVGPSIGKETEQNAAKAVIVASLVIIGYIAFAFRKIPKPYSSLKFGICAVAALIHDLLVIVGIFSLLGHFFKVEVDSLFITALLTIMGFSVHDTIVVFDRIRENLKKMPGTDFAVVVNESIIQTLARSFSTSLTVLLTLLALLLFGGESTRWFIAALLIGITSGTYSSVFNAAPLLVLWEEWGRRK